MGRRRRTAQRLATYHLLHRPQYHMTYKTSSRHHHKFPKVGARAASMAPDEKWPRRIAPGSAMCATRTSGMKRSTTCTSKMIISHALRKDAHSLVLSLWWQSTSWSMWKLQMAVVWPILPEELAAWRSMRKANFPSKGNLKRKAELEEKRRQSGALPDPPKVSMLEKLLRRTHQVERGKGFGGFGYKGFGKKGKFKGKGKDGKGKEGKGKDWKGKDGKGQGKTSGKKGKGKSKWSVERDGEPERRLDHATYSVPLPSVVANCVPLEAPFGGAPTSQVIPPSLPKWGPCRFFDRGFCFHGENCQYEHVGAGAMTQKVINATAWWALPSSLANRAGRPGGGTCWSD